MGRFKTNRNTYFKDQVKSALQKSVRLGKDEDACFWVSELDLNGNGNETFKRLKVMCAEDIGLGNPHSIIRVNELYNKWIALLGKKGFSKSHLNKDARKLLIKACLIICRSPKSRMAATVSFVFLSKYNGYLEEKSKLDDIDEKLTKEHLSLVSKCEEERIKVAITRLMKGILFFQHKKEENKETEKKSIKIVRDSIKDDCFASITALFEWTPHKKEEKCPLDSKQNTRELAWKALFLCCNKTQISIARANYEAWQYDMNNRLFLVVTLLYLLEDIPSVDDIVVDASEVEAIEKKCYEENPKLEIPDSAIDKHTGAGKKLGRGVLHFFTEGAKVAKERFEDPYRDECLEAYLNEEKQYGRKHRSEHVRKRKRSSFKKSKGKEAEEDSEESSSEEEDEVEKSTKKRKRTEKKSSNSEKKSKKNEESEDMEIESNGKEEEEKEVGEKDNANKEVLKEKDVMKDVIQAQIIRGKKPATYYAEMYLPGKEPRRVFVKGPFDNRSQKTFHRNTAEMHVFLDNLKPYLGDELHTIGMEIMELIPGGVIEEFHGEKPAAYLVMKDLCYEGKKYQTMTKSSKTVKNARLFDESGTSTKLIAEDLLENNSEACFQLLCNLCYRYVMEINDTCNCNLMLDTTNNWVYSIDETSCFEKRRDTLFRHYFFVLLLIGIRTKCSKRMKSILFPQVKKHKDNLEAMLKRWEDKFENDEEIASLFKEKSFSTTKAKKNCEYLIKELNSFWDKLL